MPINDLRALLRRLLHENGEKPWLEFKHNNGDPDLIAKTICACANAAMLADKDRAYLVWGIEDSTLTKVGTTVRLEKLTKGGEALENWLCRIIEPRLMMEFHDFIDSDGKHHSSPLNRLMTGPLSMPATHTFELDNTLNRSAVSPIMSGRCGSPPADTNLRTQFPQLTKQTRKY